MQRGDRIIEVIGSAPRLRIMQLLSQRPRSVKELAEVLMMTTQAVLKHLSALEAAGIVRKVEVGLRIGLVRGLYRLQSPSSVRILAGDEKFAVHVLVVRGEGTKRKGKLGKSKFTQVIGRLEEEKYLLERRMKLLEEREERTFTEFARILREEDNVLEGARIDPIEELLLRAYFVSESEFVEAAKALGVSAEEAKTVLRPFLTQNAVEL